MNLGVVHRAHAAVPHLVMTARRFLCHLTYRPKFEDGPAPRHHRITSGALPNTSKRHGPISQENMTSQATTAIPS